MLQSLTHPPALPPPGHWLDEIEQNLVWSRWGWDYVDKRLEFDGTNCCFCEETIGPYLGERENQYGTVECSEWREAWGWMDRLYCADCAEATDPPPVSWFAMTPEMREMEQTWR